MVYIDAFNLYYGALKGTPYKWLDVLQLAKLLLRPENNVVGIKYFTALVIPRQNDPDQLTRQKIYLRALRSIKAEIIYGQYLSHVVKAYRATCKPGEPRMVEIIKSEEKGSDVNIASHMLLDAFNGKYDCAVLVSGDSDLTTPLKMARYDFKKTVGVLNPQKNPCKALKGTATFYKHIRESALASAQFPVVLSDEQGSFHKPTGW